eukprot:TRINITY_DN6447_c0_g3_i10.p2 TRINITY_DN6447_c0_g3~~TRINITY_DN6447_c0_g3_i10.p2  ORF type:complete len:121 (-),score=3.38 TRINITY_DN6447_c0_g3_i10:781-1143(-)
MLIQISDISDLKIKDDNLEITYGGTVENIINVANVEHAMDLLHHLWMYSQQKTKIGRSRKQIQLQLRKQEKIQIQIMRYKQRGPSMKDMMEISCVLIWIGFKIFMFLLRWFLGCKSQRKY